MAILWDTLFLFSMFIGAGLSLGIFLFAVGILRVKEVKPGMAIPFQYLGNLAYCAISFAEHHIDQNYNIVVGRGAQSTGFCWCIWRVGNWMFYIWPLGKAMPYADFNESDGFGSGEAVDLGDITFDLANQLAETKDGVGVNVVSKATGRILNVRKFLVIAPKDVAKQVKERLEGVIRAWIISRTDAEAQNAKGNGNVLWNQLHDPPVEGKGTFDYFKAEWGVEIREKTVLVTDVGYDEAYQKARKARLEQTLMADGEAERIGKPVRLMMEQWIAQQSIEAGIATADSPATPDALAKLVAKLKRSKEYQRKEQYFEGLRAKALAGEGYERVERSIDISSGGNAINPDVAGIVTAAEAIAGAFGQQRRRRSNPGGQKNPQGRRKGKPRDMDDDEAEDAADGD